MSPSSTDPVLLLQDRILYEDNHLLIVNKRAGEIVQGDQTGDKPLLELVRDYIRVKGNKHGNVFCGLVHRIDRPVSGAVIYAKTSKALSRMNEMVKNRKIRKIYWAVVEGVVTDAPRRLVHYMWKNEKLNKSFVSEVEKENWRKAELSYTLLGASERYSLLEIELHTGRHHQIRAQLSAIGHPIKGDLKYGAKRSNEDGSIALHAHQLVFEHPVSHETLNILAEPFAPLFRKMLGE